MNWKILHKYLQGTCSDAEYRTLRVWLQKNPANEDFFISLVEEWSENKNIELDYDTQAEWAKFQKNNLASDTDLDVEFFNSSDSQFRISENYLNINKKRRRYSRAYWTYSAVAVMLLILALLFVIPQLNVESSMEKENEITYQEINTVDGQRSSLKLSDGSSVILNASSSLRIPQDYGIENRTLFLEGEAFFEVEHDEENPFMVISHQTYTKDLGTAFNITAYDSSQIEVAVEEGLVSLGKMNKGTPQKEIVELTPNKLGILKEVGGLTVSDIKEIDQYTGWTKGKLVFNRTPFSRVVKRLERWYDINCEIEGDVTQIENRTLTATYDNMPMSEVLQVLSISMDLSYTSQGRTVIFKEGNDLKVHE